MPSPIQTLKDIATFLTMKYVGTPESSCMSGFEYLPDTQKLTIFFHRGGTETFDASPEIAFGLYSAESRGGYYNAYLKR